MSTINVSSEGSLGVPLSLQVVVIVGGAKLNSETMAVPVEVPVQLLASPKLVIA